MKLPTKIKKSIGPKYGKQDNIGMSGASVYLFDDIVLKVQNDNFEAKNEQIMMQWLNDKLPVPQIIECEKSNKLSYLLMSRCNGEIACNSAVMANPKKLCELLGETLYKIWSVDIEHCPTDSSLEEKLRQAKYNVVQQLVDMDNCDPTTFRSGNFKDPESLLCWLQNNKPCEELVLSHGDLCLPNILFESNELSGLIDLGKSGMADKWCDIAICYRSLRDNYSGKYRVTKDYGFKESYFFDALQIKPDWERIRYYLLLDELF